MIRSLTTTEQHNKQFITRDGEVPSKKELSSYFKEFFSNKVPRQKELSSSNEELFTNPVHNSRIPTVPQVRINAIRVEVVNSVPAVAAVPCS